jgi:magnesium-transporting ATPase (P-type)
MFGREDKSPAKHEINRGITRKISYVCVAIISINYLIWFANLGIYFRITGEYNHTLRLWTGTIFSGVFLVAFCILLLVALLWVYHSLRHDEQLMGNEKWMAAHLVLLTLVLGSFIYSNYTTTYTAWKIYDVIDTLVYLLMAYIMDQVNGPQYTVWANRKFVGRNKEEVAQHILHDRESINDLPDEVNVN